MINVRPNVSWDTRSQLLLLFNAEARQKITTPFKGKFGTGRLREPG